MKCLGNSIIVMHFSLSCEYSGITGTNIIRKITQMFFENLLFSKINKYQSLVLLGWTVLRKIKQVIVSECVWMFFWIVANRWNAWETYFQ